MLQMFGSVSRHLLVWADVGRVLADFGTRWVILA